MAHHRCDVDERATAPVTVRYLGNAQKIVSIPMVAKVSALLLGVVGYGISMAIMLRAGLGLAPWDVLHHGVSRQTGMSLGATTAAVGVVVLLMWIPQRIRPGIGTVSSVIVIAITVDIALRLVPGPASPLVAIAMMVGGAVLNAVSTVLYIGAGLGPGPRDGLTAGLVATTKLSVGPARTTIDATVLLAGWLLGGTVGIGTLVYAFSIGPLVHLTLSVVPQRWLTGGGWAFTVSCRTTAPGHPPSPSVETVRRSTPGSHLLARSS